MSNQSHQEIKILNLMKIRLLFKKSRPKATQTSTTRRQRKRVLIANRFERCLIARKNRNKRSNNSSSRRTIHPKNREALKPFSKIYKRKTHLLKFPPKKQNWMSIKLSEPKTWSNRTTRPKPQRKRRITPSRMASGPIWRPPTNQALATWCLPKWGPPGTAWTPGWPSSPYQLHLRRPIPVRSQIKRSQ